MEDIIEDTFAEAFRSYYSRLLITADDISLAKTAAECATGFATSALGCGVEAGIDCQVKEKETPDSRPGVLIQFHIWSKKKKKMYEVLLERIGHCVLTAPTTAVFDATPNPFTRVDLGSKLKYFGDGFEKETEIWDRKMAVIPIMGGEFMVENEAGMSKGISGGNLWLMGRTQGKAINAAKRSVKAISEVEGAITPFPGGICSSGSKVGAERYGFLANSTNHLYCPTLTDKVPSSKVPKNVDSIMEIVINGTSLQAVRKAMQTGVKAAKDAGIERISAGNFGGKLGKFKLKLKDLEDSD